MESSKKVYINITGDTTKVNLNKIIKYKKVRISYLNYTTSAAGSRNLFVLFDGHNQHPMMRSTLSFDYYFKVLPMYGGAAVQFLYTNEQGFDVVFDSEHEISEIRLTTIINGVYGSNMISSSYPLELELEFIN